MYRRSRLAMLLVIGALSAAFVALDGERVQAQSSCSWTFTPTCHNGVGSYTSQTYYICQGSCVVGSIYFTYQCVDDGVLHPTNVNQHTTFLWKPVCY